MRTLDRPAIEEAIEGLMRLGFLVPEADARGVRSRLSTWRHNLASAHYHVASRNLEYVKATRSAMTRHALDHIALDRRPARFKRYRVPVRRSLRGPFADDAVTLTEALQARRTVRAFSRTAVPFAELARVVSGTWGRTGILEGGLFGRLLTKTSPSGGALHPIEAYVIAWNVQGLAAGLYHYDVAANELRRLKRGDFRKEAIRAASGQKWVGRAGFVCVMTAMFTRSLWKYQSENAYRILWLDAGHLAQTFCLLATARGLGPYTTAALQDSFLEEFLGVDGIREFPVYLCGAGVRQGAIL
jgi:SagB-type dehydrogenase family enzyme